MALATVTFGMTTIIGVELEYRHNRRIDVPAETLRAFVKRKMKSMNFATPLYFFGVSNASAKFAGMILVVSMTMLSVAYHLLVAEDVLMIILYFFPSLQKTMGTTATPVITYEQHISLFFHIFWRYIIPPVLLATVITEFASKTILMELSWTSIITTLVCTLPMLYAIKAITSMWRQRGVKSILFRPTDRWGPLSIQKKKIAEFDEKAARFTI
ncbi:hypothetical protein KIN20_031635 [Parelaphostrongylus tenuis]|uniref:Uncharacterized protein n=1 Tax=Parelaphostrongylus tenuis TaxID=148309 RepID=A0AAD5R5U0_PARTN|nr:hypothetical protein KIN20_031635 [Parelaphostrongylus tenuis]